MQSSPTRVEAGHAIAAAARELCQAQVDLAIGSLAMVRIALAGAKAHLDVAAALLGTDRELESLRLEWSELELDVAFAADCEDDQ